MDKQLAKLIDLFPDSDFVQIRKYDENLWKTRAYSSKLENKAPMNTWKTNPYNGEKIKKLSEEGYRVGWVVPDGYVVVDVDNDDNPKSADKIEEILKEQGVRYCKNKSFRGAHFLFKDTARRCQTDASTKCSLGITVDHRANSRGYIILPTNDPHREWCEWVDSIDEIDEIPFYLYPLMSAKGMPNFIDLEEGGRNEALYHWRRSLLEANKLDDDEITQSLYLINDHLLKTPMDEKEMESSVVKKRMTDETIRNSKEASRETSLEKENIYNSIANRISREYDMMCVGEKRFYIFDKTHYKLLETMEVERLVHYGISENINAAGRAEVLKFLALKNYVRADEVDKVWNKIAVNNGILDVVTGDLSEPTKEDKNTIAIPWNYNPDPPYSPAIDEFMNHLAGSKDNGVDELKKQFLYQIVGYCLLKDNYFEKFFIFQGEGQTGKSTFQDLIVKLIGERNRSRVGLDKMDNDYYLATTMGKLVNIDDDAVDGKALENSGRFKSLVTGGEITCRQIFREPVTFAPFCTCMFSCNKLPRIMDKTSGLYRRLIIIELNNKVRKPDPLFLQKLTARDMEYFLYQAVYWVGVALQEGQFRINESESDILRKFKCRQSSINEWVYDENLTLGEVYEKNTYALFSMYYEYAGKNGHTKLPSHTTFKEEMCSLYNLEIGYRTKEHRANQSIFVRDIPPTEEELNRLPF